jgi:hypothetical protein
MKVLFLFFIREISRLNRSSVARDDTVGVYPQSACRIVLTRGSVWFKMVASGTEWGSN